MSLDNNLRHWFAALALGAAATCGCAEGLQAADSLDELVARGKFTEALPILEAARDAAASAGRHDREVAMLLNNLGSVCYELGRYREAESAYERSLSIRRDLAELHTREAVRTLSNLGIVYLKLELATKAEQTLDRAAALDQELDAQPLELAKIWANLGLVYQTQKRWSEAEELFRKTLAIRERELDPSHPDVALALNNLGALLQQQRRWEEAQPLLERAVHIWESELGAVHPKVAAGLDNLGVLYTNLGRTHQAEDCFQRAIHIATVSLPPDHPSLAAYMTSYALLLRKLDRKDEALRLEKSARLIRERNERTNLIGLTSDARQTVRQ